ncbi:MAG: alpha/beta hydrolase [Anaerolineae bacterium]|nr:alpha/beta hydrolase [Anaerolineae bacterium]
MPSLLTRAVIAMMRFSLRGVDYNDYSIEQIREQTNRTFIPLPRGIQIEPIQVGHVPVDWIDMPASEPDRVVLYLPGGGYCVRATHVHHGIAARFAQAIGGRALFTHYRLAPENPYPDGLVDAMAIYRWLLSVGVSPQQILIAGDSAGGGLAAALLIALRDAGDPMPAAAVLLSPWLDLTLSGDSIDHNAESEVLVTADLLQRYADAYAGEYDLREPLLSPLFADLKGLPPILIQVTDTEILLSDSEQFAHRAQAAGVPVKLEVWPGLLHAWHFFPYFPETRQAMQAIGVFARQHLAGGGSDASRLSL